MEAKTKKNLIIVGSLVAAVILLAAAYTFTQESPEKTLTPATESVVTNQVPIESQAVTDLNVSPSAPIDSDAVSSKVNNTVISAPATFGVTSAAITKERADQILSSFSKEAKNCKEGSVGAEASSKKPNLSAPIMAFGRNVLPHGSQMNVPEGVSMQMPQLQDATVLAPPVPQVTEIKINGIICEKQVCTAMTSAGSLINGTQVGIEKISSVSKSGIKTDKRFIAF